MQDLKIVLVQANQAWEDKTANFENYERLLKDVDTDLIILPEMFQTGFSMNTSELAEKWGESTSVNWLKKISHNKSAAIFTSLIIEEEGNYYNRGVFIYPNGEVKKYDKRKSFGLAGEDQFYSPGQKEVIVVFQGWRFQLQICYDLRFPEIVRNSISSNQKPNYDVILYVANWPEKRALHWNSLLQARAIENQCFVAACNRVGIDKNKLTYNGCSKVVSPLGEIMVENCKGEEQLIYTKLERKVLSTTIKKLPFLKDC